MKALTIRQPWASLIAHGVKTIETRSWSTKYRGPLAIHAGLKRPSLYEPVGGWWLDDLTNGGMVAIGPDDEKISLPFGAVVATCALVDVRHADGGRLVDDDALRGDVNWSLVDHSWRQAGEDFLIRRRELPFGDFTPGRFAWLLEDITPIDPVPAKGKQGLWEWTP